MSSIRPAFITVTILARRGPRIGVHRRVSRSGGPRAVLSWPHHRGVGGVGRPRMRGAPSRRRLLRERPATVKGAQRGRRRDPEQVGRPLWRWAPAREGAQRSKGCRTGIEPVGTRWSSLSRPGDFDKLNHRTRSITGRGHRRARSAGARMRGRVHVAERVGGHESVDLGRRDRRVPEQFLHDPHVRSPSQEVRGERVPQGMR
jgi:hypothetical protein